MSKPEKWSIAMVVFRKWSVIIIIVVILAFLSCVILYENQQVRQTLCTLRCQHIEDNTAWETCIGECLKEIVDD